MNKVNLLTQSEDVSLCRSCCYYRSTVVSQSGASSLTEDLRPGADRGPLTRTTDMFRFGQLSSSSLKHQLVSAAREKLLLSANNTYSPRFRAWLPYRTNMENMNVFMHEISRVMMRIRKIKQEAPRWFIIFFLLSNTPVLDHRQQVTSV